MSITASLPNDKSHGLAQSLREIAEKGALSRKAMGSAVGEMSIAQTSIFGRAGRAMMTTLYRNLNVRYYSSALSDRGLSALRRGASDVDTVTPRLAKERTPQTYLIIYTDAEKRPK